MREVGDDLKSFMREAIAQGKLALPACLPNPPVGCVLVRERDDRPARRSSLCGADRSASQEPGARHTDAARSWHRRYYRFPERGGTTAFSAISVWRPGYAGAPRRVVKQ